MPSARISKQGEVLQDIADWLDSGERDSHLQSLTSIRQPAVYNLELTRVRRINPRVLFIGDSMLGSRIDPTHMTRTVRQQACGGKKGAEP